ncbi:MAG: hypothetical protein L3J07_00275 [Candidatus Magasanikbacteria bacterium]|nr:hypothetical protein [Candidatus Magasanikbacteria bacterium]
MGKQISVLLIIFCLFLVGCNKKEDTKEKTDIEIFEQIQIFDCPKNTTYTEVSGEEFTTEYYCLDENSKKIGPFQKYSDETGSIITVGEFLKDKPFGKWAQWDKNGNLLVIGMFNENSEADGFAAMWEPDGTYAVMYFENGKIPDNIFIFNAKGKLDKIFITNIETNITRSQLDKDFILKIEEETKEDLAKILDGLPKP